MPSLVQLGTQQVFTANPDSITLTGATAGKFLVACSTIVSTSISISSITDANVTWSRIYGPLVTAGGTLECWIGEVTSSGNVSSTVNFSGGTPAGGSGCSVTEITLAAGYVVGPSNNLAASADANPLVLAPVDVDGEAITFTWTRNTTNFGISAWNDGFAAAVSGAQIGRTFAGYRITSGAVSLAPTTTMTSTESADSATVTLYDSATKRGVLVVGKDGDITSSLTVLFNLDGVDRTKATGTPVNAEGSHAIGGNLMLIEQPSAPTGIANAVRLFTEDNGSGKTRLMAQFGSGAAVQIAIEP